MKNKTMTFEQKAQQLTAKQMVELMIDAVRNPVVKLDLDTFGTAMDGECYGCAATNAICKLSGATFTVNDVGLRNTRASAVDADYFFLESFECAIDYLRCGMISRYNWRGGQIGLAHINGNDADLPTLKNSTYKENLHFYEQLAEAQDEQ